MTTRLLLLLSFELLLIFTKIVASLIAFKGVFIDSYDVTISPFDFRSKQHHNVTQSFLPPWTAVGVSATTMARSNGGVILCLYIPVVLVPFALLSSLLSAYGKGAKGALWTSASCQAASSGLYLMGLVWFLRLHWAYVNAPDMTLGFYLCVLATTELTVTTCLSFVLLRYQREQTMVAENHLALSRLPYRGDE